VESNERIERDVEREDRESFFSRSPFLMAMSIAASIAIWFVLSINKATTDNLIVYDVPIQIQMSDVAQNEGIKVFNQSVQEVDIKVKSSSAAISKDDFEIIADFSPDSTKVSGVSMNSQVVTLRAQKKNNLQNITILEVSPEEIRIDYDRVHETSFPLSDEIKRTVDVGFYILDPVFSDTKVTVSGPESSMNKIDYAALVYAFDNPLRQDAEVSVPVTLYGLDGKKISDYSRLNLTLGVENVEVSLPVLTRKSVPLEATFINMPKSFSDSRITVSPETLDIAARAEDIADIEKIALSEAIDFREINFVNNQFEIEIPLSKEIRNLSQTDTARVSVSLGGYKEIKFTTKNINLVNSPNDRIVPITQSLTVSIVGSEAQVSKLTAESIYVTVDMAGKMLDMTENMDSAGIVQYKANVQINGAETCWATGSYMVDVGMREESELSENSSSATPRPIEANPQE